MLIFPIMKKLIFILFLLISSFNYSQVDFNKNVSLTMHKEIEPLVENFISDAEKRGFYVRSLIFNNIDFILFDSSLKQQGLIEGVSEDSRTIYLSENIKHEKLKLKIAVYHGIGHILKNSGDHGCYMCYEIMTENIPQDLSIFEKNWEEKLNTYFNWLNKK